MSYRSRSRKYACRQGSGRKSLLVGEEQESFSGLDNPLIQSKDLLLLQERQEKNLLKIYHRYKAKCGCYREERWEHCKSPPRGLRKTEAGSEDPRILLVLTRSLAPGNKSSVTGVHALEESLPPPEDEAKKLRTALW